MTDPTPPPADHRVTWFAPDRPVGGGTIYVRPPADDCECCGGPPDLVCDACGDHACWAGRFLCDDAETAGTVLK